MVRDIIVQKVKDVKKYVLEQNLSFLKSDEQDAFLEDLVQDLTYLDAGHVRGIGITPEELAAFRDN